MTTIRRVFVFIHGYTGLVMALFLVIEGLTGSLLAFNTALDRAINPQFFAMPKPGAQRMKLGALAVRAEKLEPSIKVDYLLSNPNTIYVRVEPRIPPGGNADPKPSFTLMYLDPWTGVELGRRNPDDYTKLPMNLMPLIYGVHDNLIAGAIGTTILGVVAILWTIDCFVSLYVTFPTVRREFWNRWKLAWKLKWNAGSFRLHFDIHRAGGLWLWPMLLVFAWSSVMLALPEFWWSVTSSVMPTQSATDVFADAADHPRKRVLSWEQADVVGRKLLIEQGRAHGFTVGDGESLAYIEGFGVYDYSASSSIDVRGESADTGLYLDSQTGKFRTLFMAQHAYLGNTLNIWLWGLHYGDIHNNIVYRIAVATIGVVIAAISWTGVVIWFKKRRARRTQRSTAINAARQDAITL